MGFVPVSRYIGEAHKVRTIELKGSPQLPDGEYVFVDTYCCDPTCDCRKTMIVVELNGTHVSTINYGWESAKYYEKWMGGTDDIAKEMCGASIDITGPNLVSSSAMLSLFEALLNKVWIKKFKSHYAAVKREIKKQNH